MHNHEHILRNHALTLPNHALTLPNHALLFRSDNFAKINCKKKIHNDKACSCVALLQEQKPNGTIVIHQMKYHFIKVYYSKTITVVIQIF